MAKKTNDQKPQSPEVSIAAKSGVKPDYTKVVPAFQKILDALKEHTVKPTPWHETESIRVMTNLAQAGAPIAVVIISTFEKTIFEGKDLSAGYEMLDTFVRPQGSFLHSESPCPSSFMQRSNLLIDKVNANLEEHVTDPNFWWQPITNPVVYNLVAAVNALKEKCAQGEGVDFLAIKNRTV